MAKKSFVQEAFEILKKNVGLAVTQPREFARGVQLAAQQTPILNRSILNPQAPSNNLVPQTIRNVMPLTVARPLAQVQTRIAQPVVNTIKQIPGQLYKTYINNPKNEPTWINPPLMQIARPLPADPKERNQEIFNRAMNLANVFATSGPVPVKGKLPQLNADVKQVLQKQEQGIANAESNKAIRDLFSSSEINVINRLKALTRSRAFKEGDIETIRKLDKDNVVERALQIVKEKNPHIVEEADALNYAINLPTQAQTKPPVIRLTPEQKKLRFEALKEQKQFEADFGRAATEKEQLAEINAWEANIKGSTTPPYKGGKTPASKGLPSETLSTAPVKDKNPFSYQRETLLRNIEDTFGKASGKIKSFFHDPIVTNETANVSFKNQLRTRLEGAFNKLGVKRGSKEDFAAADFIEGNISLDQLKKEFPKSWERVIKASEEGRVVYKDLLSKINKAIGEYGYAPIKERQNYVTHTQQIQTLVERFGDMLNFTKEKLPTEISSINVSTKPGRQFFRFGLQRQGGSTHEGLITALDKYIEPAGNQIFHTADIQRGRALQNYLLKSADPQDTRLSNFSSYLGQYVDSLAGKQNIIDRPFEKVFGRGLLNIGNWFRKRTGANMVGGNVSSALTNFIPFTQSIATTSKPAVAKGLYSASTKLANPAVVDGIQSNFLLRRFPKEQIGSTLGSTAREMASWLFRRVDQFTAHSVVAGKYFENLSKGLSKEQAMSQADEYAARVLADRSYGQIPLIFNSKVLGALTQFQVEVNNQVSFFLKDVPKNLSFSKKQIASVLGQAVLYSYLFNNIFEKVTGRRPQVDPLHAALSMYQGISEGKPAKDLLDPTNQNTPVGELVQNLPFTSFYGGRIPISAALPDPFALMKGETTPKKELSKLAFYVAPPFGGGQVKKTLEGVKAYSKGASTTDKGLVRFPIEQGGGNIARSTLFGQYATPNAREYFAENRKPLSERQSKIFFATSNPSAYYESVQANRQKSRAIKQAKLEAARGAQPMIKLPSVPKAKTIKVSKGKIKTPKIKVKKVKPIKIKALKVKKIKVPKLKVKK